MAPATTAPPSAAAAMWSGPSIGPSKGWTLALERRAAAFHFLAPTDAFFLHRLRHLLVGLPRAPAIVRS